MAATAWSGGVIHYTYKDESSVAWTTRAWFMVHAQKFREEALQEETMIEAKQGKAILSI